MRPYLRDLSTVAGTASSAAGAAAGAALGSRGAVNGDKSAAVAAHPEDFIMYKIGMFDDQKGEYLPMEHVQLARGKDLVAA